MDWESVVEYVRNHNITSVDQYYDMRAVDCSSSGESITDVCMGCERCTSLSKWLETALIHHLEGRSEYASRYVMYEDLIMSIRACSDTCGSSVRDPKKKIAYMKKLMKVCMKMCTNKPPRRTVVSHRRTVKA